MHCKSCDCLLTAKELKLARPDGEPEDLCAKCLRAARSEVDPSWRSVENYCDFGAAWMQGRPRRRSRRHTDGTDRG